MATPTILIVEDEFLIAMQIEEDVRSFGYAVAATAGSSKKALELLREHDVDLTLLDVNLADGSAAPVAEALAARGTPFIFLTGYGSQGVPPGFSDAPLLRKPISSGALREAIRDILEH